LLNFPEELIIEGYLAALDKKYLELDNRKHMIFLQDNVITFFDDR